MTVRENLQTALLSARGETGGWWRDARRRQRGRADALLERIGLAGQQDRPAADLCADGRRQLDLALALALRPRLLLLDEPTGGMSEAGGAALLGIVHRLARDHDVAVLLATDDPAAAAARADRVLALERGVLVAEHRSVAP